MELQKTRVDTRFITSVGVMAAIAFALQMLGSMMQIKVGGFLEVEISDLPAMMISLAIGPVAGVLVELIKNILHCTITTTGFVGEFANFIINGVFVFVAGSIYKFYRTKKGAIIALTVGTVAIAVAGALANLFIMLPLYMPTAPFLDKLNLVLFTITPFNIVKGIVLSVITAILYKRVSKVIK